ncbi:MAG: deoxyribodipyrimidine photo-lyase [Acidimicrobiia bacterium]|nr:deoxyribodipyrimidine photo-lyase [Acidimicrobiia bacterium]
MAAVLWFRRDLRLADHPALLAALEAGDEVVPLFVLDPKLQSASGPPRLSFLAGCLADLRDRTDDALVTRTGDPVEVVPKLAAEVGAEEVFVTDDFGPYGRRRDEAVAAALEGQGRRLVAVDSPYVVPPGTLSTAAGGSFQVFTPFYRAWGAQGAPTPWPAPKRPRWASGVVGERVPDPVDLGGTTILPPGEAAATRRLERFLGDQVQGYAVRRDVPGVDATSRLSVYLKYGCIHPRTALHGLGRGKGAERFRTEVAWRDFYASVLAAHPESAREPLRTEMKAMRVETGRRAESLFERWAEGRTGYPIVDAGMRQLVAEAWVHNRVRMVVASFLVKDLHLPWRWGARLFMQRLQDGALASNNPGWQWVAGTGTDPAPYIRVFNPMLQGAKFDPDGDYVRRWVPELAGVAGKAVHEPWKLDGGPPEGYPMPIVDHLEEREEALARFGEVSAGR